jgi:tetratricopeptide (TPR) repeat protein
VIVGARLLEPAATLDRGLLGLFARARAPYAFYAEDLVSSAPSAQADKIRPYALVAAGLRGAARDDVVERILAGHGDKRLRIAHGSDLASLDLLPSEHTVVERLMAEPSSAGELIARSGDPETARRVLYLLTITRMTEAYDEAASAPARASFPPRASLPAGRPSGAPTTAGRLSAPPKALTPHAPEPPPTAPTELNAERRAEWTAIAEAVTAMDEQSYFELLGVDEAASIEDIAAAYAERVKRFHPDRLAKELAPLAPFCQGVFHRLTEAKKALSDPDARMAHVKAVRAGGGTPAHDRKLEAIVGAAMEFQKAEILIRQRKYDEALALLDRIIAIEPNEGDYLARKAWVLFLMHPEKKGPFASEILALTDKALARNERHEQAHFTRASMLKRQGHTEAALEHFRHAARANPKNIDAVREIRLADMRGRASAPPRANPQDAGLLQKLFGKKP